jgi:hypothetical protein
MNVFCFAEREKTLRSFTNASAASFDPQDRPKWPQELMRLFAKSLR